MDQSEIKALMNEMLDQVSQRHMDEKFEEAFHDVSNTVSHIQGAPGKEGGGFNELNQKLES